MELARYEPAREECALTCGESCNNMSPLMAFSSTERPEMSVEESNTPTKTTNIHTKRLSVRDALKKMLQEDTQTNNKPKEEALCCMETGGPQTSSKHIPPQYSKLPISKHPITAHHTAEVRCPTATRRCPRPSNGQPACLACSPL